MMVSSVSYYQPNYMVDNQQTDAKTGDQESHKHNNQTQAELKKRYKHELSQEQKLQVIELQKRDIEVRIHEAAHMAAGAGLTTGATYSYRRGPDNKLYAVGGEVGIDTSPANTAQETLKKAAQIKRAALAPAQPSPADLQVAATATNMEIDAKIEIQNELLKEQKQDQQNDDKNQSNKHQAEQNESNLIQHIYQNKNNPYAQYDYSSRVIGLF